MSTTPDALTVLREVWRRYTRFSPADFRDFLLDEIARLEREQAEAKLKVDNEYRIFGSDHGERD